MKAAVNYTYGPPDVIEIRDVPQPVPAVDEVLIRVHAATVNRTDTGMRSAAYFVSRLFTGLVKPTQPIGGSECAGEVVEVGSSVTEFKVGDRVFGFDDIHAGAHAEFVARKANGALATIPEAITYEQIAPAGEGATYALSDIQASGIRKGQKALVYGASGAIGSAAVQILKYMGVTVTAVCGTENVERIRQLGPDVVIDYKTSDFTQTDEKFDFIFDAVGKSSYGACKHLMNEGASYCSTELGKYGQNIFLALWFGITGQRKVIFPIPKINKDKIEYIKQLIEAGAFTPLVDKTYALDDIVEATRYVESGQKVGNVVIRIAEA